MLNFLKSRRFRQGSVATAVTAIVVALIIVFNMVITSLSDKYSLNLDLTANKMFGISEQTKDFLASLNKDVSIFVLSTEEDFTAGNQYFVSANEVVKKYAQQSSHVKLQYIDLVRNPNFEKNYPKVQLASGNILVVCGEKYTDLTPYDLYNIETDAYQQTQRIISSQAEQAMTTAMLKVTTDKTVGVSFLTGHNEKPLEGLQSLLEINGYEVSEQNLFTEEIGSESKIAIMCAPERDLTDDELKRLDAFLSNGEKLGRTFIYFASREQGTLPNLEAFLADWGIGIGESVVFESSLNRVLNFDMLLPAVDYTEDVYSETAVARNLFTLVAYAKPLTALFDSKSSITVTTALAFSQTSGVLPLDATEDWVPQESDLSGPIPALIVSHKLAYEGTTPLRSNVVVCGSDVAVEDSILSTASFGNGDYFLNMINILAERDDIVSIQAKTIGGNELGIQSHPEQVLILGIIFVVLLPLAVLIYGIVIWLRRRHR